MRTAQVIEIVSENQSGLDAVRARQINKRFNLCNNICHIFNTLDFLIQLTLLILFAVNYIRLTEEHIYWYFNVVIVGFSLINILMSAISSHLLKEFINVKKTKHGKRLSWASMVFTIMFVCFTIASLCGQDYHRIGDQYGPIFFPYNDQIQVHWWTKQKQSTLVQFNGQYYTSTNNINSTQQITDSADVLGKSHFHNVLLPRANGTYKVFNTINGSSVDVVQQYPDQVTRMLISSDSHGVRQYAQLIGSDFQLHLHAGDVSMCGHHSEFFDNFYNTHTRPTIMCVGNHDQIGEISQIMQRDYNYFKQTFADVSVYSLFIFKYASITENRKVTTKMLKWLQTELQAETSSKVFILIHQPIYSKGFFGAKSGFTARLNEVIDATNKVTAVISGHDHIFSAYERNGVNYFVVGSGGGYLDRPQGWSAQGPTSGFGGEHHLASYSDFAKLEVDFAGNGIKYTLRRLVDQAVIWEYSK
ncbi:Alkaline_phosphatase [Hexamita inflata]|uniref:Alkaline phosphatase n=1 Tax=Hexamita inflata TaxID=28002 RepID=A0AA86PQE3_9EUKA|nr:Alkaline phosphatase [Hexamita inflata]